MIETEMKFKVADINAAGVIWQKLHSLGYESEPIVKEVDTYYNPPGISFGLTDEAFRIRESKQSDIDLTYLTYKGPKQGDIGKIREELEVCVSLGDTTKLHQIFTALRFEIVGVVSKDRTAYVHPLNAVRVMYDNVSHLGHYFELEVLTQSERQTQEAFSLIKNFALGIGLEKEERRGYIQIQMAKYLSEISKYVLGKSSTYREISLNEDFMRYVEESKGIHEAAANDFRVACLASLSALQYAKDE